MEPTQEFEQLLLSRFTTDEQRIFVKHFQTYLKYGNNYTQFVLDFDEVYEWLGFTHKHHAKRLLVKKLEENVDYVMTSLLTSEGEQSIGRQGGHNKNIIKLTVPAFKAFSMLCDTDKGKQTRLYYTKMEEIFFSYMQKQHEKTVDTIIKTAKKDKERRCHEILMRSFAKMPCVYIAKLYEEDDLVKIGETDDMFERVKTLKNEYKVADVIILECVPCSDPRRYEQYIIKQHSMIAPRRIGTTEFIKLDDTLTLDKLIDIVRRNKYTYADGNVSDKDIVDKKETALSEERLYLYKRIAEATDMETRRFWEDKLNNVYEAFNTSTKQEDAPSTSNAHVHSYRRVYQYNPDDLSNPVAEYISLKEAARSFNNHKLHDHHVREACFNNTLLEGFRWYFVDNDTIKPETIPATCEVETKLTKRLGLIAQLNTDGTEIRNIYTSQREAAKAVKLTDCSITVALSRNTCCAKSRWKMYDDCDETLKQTFKGIVPQYKAPETCNKKIQRLDANTGKVLETYNCLQDVCAQFRTCHKTLKKKSEDGSTYKGYKWRVIRNNTNT
jgi:phage anti-repressor protein